MPGVVIPSKKTEPVLEKFVQSKDDDYKAQKKGSASVPAKSAGRSPGRKVRLTTPRKENLKQMLKKGKLTRKAQKLKQKWEQKAWPSLNEFDIFDVPEEKVKVARKKKLASDCQPPKMKLAGDGQPTKRRLASDKQSPKGKLAGKGQQPKKKLASDKQSPKGKLAGKGQQPKRKLVGGGQRRLKKVIRGGQSSKKKLDKTNKLSNAPIEKLMKNHGIKKAAMRMLFTQLETLGTNTPKKITRKRNMEDKTAAEMAAVVRLLDRYTAGKKKRQQAKKNQSDAGSGSIDNESELEDLSSDSEDEKPGENDFYKCTIPQYELKEKLYEKHSAEILSLPKSELKKLFSKILPELEGIMHGNIASKRHKLWNKRGNKGKLSNMTIYGTFNQQQDEFITELVINRMKKEGDLLESQGRLAFYGLLVLLPEAFIRIYSKVNDINLELSEKELRYKAGYDGELPDDVVSSVSASAAAATKDE